MRRAPTRGASIRRSRRAALALLTILLAACGAGRRDGAPRTAAQGVVVVTFDALRADVLGLYGHPRRTSPNLDGFADDAWAWERASSAAPLTPASFAVMFTGRYARKRGAVWTIDGGPTAAELFSDLGFATAAFLNNRWLAPAYGFARGFTHYEYSGHLRDEEVLARALSWLKRHRRRRFFLWIHLLDPHVPWLARPDAAHLYDPTYRGEFERAMAPRQVLHDAGDLARARELYEGEVFHADALFGRLWRVVRRLRLDERAVIVVSADHGEELMEHGRLQHGQLTEENLHVPLVIRPPGGGRWRIGAPVSTVDLLPTLLDLVGAEAPEPLAGRSLLEARDGRPVAAVAESAAAAVRAGDLKLIVRCDAEPRHTLFDLADDPDERRDLAAARPDAVADLERILWRVLDVGSCAELAARPRAGAPDAPGVSPEDRRALQALGYLLDDGDATR